MGSKTQTKPVRRQWMALLAMALVLVGLSIYVALKPPPRVQSPQQEEPTLEPSQDPAQRVLAQAQRLMKLDHHEEACSLMQAYIHTKMNDVTVRPMLARALMELGRNDEAERNVDQVIRLGGGRAEVLWLKGDLVALRGGQNHLRFYCMAADEAGAAEPDYALRCARQLLDADRLEEAAKYVQAARDAGLADAELAAVEGQIALSQGRLDEAQRLLGEAARQEPSAANVAMLARAQLRSAGPQQAMQTLQQHPKLAQDGAMLLARGLIHLKEGQLPQAAEAFASAAGRHQTAAEASVLAAETYLTLGRFAAAMKHIDQAAKLRPGRKDVLELKAKIEDARFQ